MVAVEVADVEVVVVEVEGVGVEDVVDKYL